MMIIIRSLNQKKYHSKDESTSPNNDNLSATIAKLEAYSKSKHLQNKESQTEEKEPEEL